MSVITRQASLSDIPAVSELFDLYRQFYDQKPNQQLALEFITARLTQQESVILVAQNSYSKLIGFCQLYPTFCSVEAKPIYSLYDLFVIPSARKSGVGNLLLQAAETQAAGAGKVRMDLTTAKTNKAAQSLYETRGWIRDDIFFAYSKKIT